MITPEIRQKGLEARLRNNGKLNKRQLAFVENYLTSLNQTQAYYDVYKPSNRIIACVNANRLLKMDKVKLHIEACVEEETSTSFIVKNMLSLLKSSKNEQTKAKMLELLGKYRAMFTDNVKTEQVNPQPYRIEIDMKAVQEHQQQLNSSDVLSLPVSSGDSKLS